MDQTDSNTVDCSIKLTSSDLQGYKLGLESSINSTGLFGISPSVSYYHKNLLRGAELFNVSLMGDFQFGFGNDKRATEFGAATSLSTPNFLLLPDKIFKSTNIPRCKPPYPADQGSRVPQPGELQDVSKHISSVRYDLQYKQLCIQA